jgi:hypothetical protein
MPLDSTGTYKMNPRQGAPDKSPTPKGKPEKPTKDSDQPGLSGKQTMVVHSHDNGHTVHVMHEDGTHEKEDYAKGDEDQVADSVRSHLGGGDTGDEDEGMDWGEEQPTEENPGF